MPRGVPRDGVRRQKDPGWVAIQLARHRKRMRREAERLTGISQLRELFATLMHLGARIEFFDDMSCAKATLGHEEVWLLRSSTPVINDDEAEQLVMRWANRRRR
jgi:hypothetical protein